MLIARNVRSAHLVVHASLRQADLRALAQLRAAAARRVSSIDQQRSVWAAGLHSMAFDDVGIRSVPCDVIGSVGNF